MKIIRKIFDSQRKNFTENGRLKMLEPLFEATESFFFHPNPSVRQSPHIRDNLDLKRFMSMVILALIPPLLYGIYNTGLQSNIATGLPASFFPAFIKGVRIVSPIIIVSYGVGFFWEVVFASIRKHPISEGFLVTGLLFPLTLPPTIPLWQVAAGISFGVVIGKEIFGGTGRNIFNPALTGRAFLFFAYPARMSGDSAWIYTDSSIKHTVDAVSGATPFACTTPPGQIENISETLQQAGYTFSKLFFGNYPGSIGGTSAFCCLIGALILILTGIASFRIILGGIAGLLTTGFIFTFLATPDSPPWMSVNPLYHLIVGGFAFGIVYMATDPVSAPGVERSKWVYGFLIGLLTVLIRVFNPAYPEGVMLAILFMNLFAPLLDYIEINLALKSRIPNA